MPEYRDRAFGGGSLGGKARGLIFAQEVLKKHKDEILARVDIPESFFVGTAVFDQFMRMNDLWDAYPSRLPFEEMERMFLQSHLPPEFEAHLVGILERIRYPLAIRSSSLIEDNIKYSCAGKYLTTFIPNSGTEKRRFSQLKTAIKQVYASTYGPNAVAYKKKHGLSGDKMAIIIQRLVGKERGGHFYPEIAGVGYSKMYRRWTERIRKEDGVVRIVFGLGTRCTGRGYARTISLTNPLLRAEGHNPYEIAKYSQETYDALEMVRCGFKSYNINERPETITYHPGIGKYIQVYSQRTNELRAMDVTGSLGPGERMVFSFENVDRYYPQMFKRMKRLFEVLEGEMGMPVDIEFAYEPEEDMLSLVQARPLSSLEEYSRVTIPASVREDDVILKGDRMLVNGKLEGVTRLACVDPDEYQSAQDKYAVARAVGYVNDSLRGERYILVGPGRWGSTNPQLGVPVRYSEIAGAGLLVELGVKKGGFVPELSYGTHFFADLESDGVLYLPVFDSIDTNIFNSEWFRSAPYEETDHPAVRVYRGKFSAFLDGEANVGVIVKEA
ncbi:MAG: phosphoenolpyruvate synthase [Firmicutes bacterium]|nr:phosphoenolpyruvate synthase [Bacillota bacterium]